MSDLERRLEDLFMSDSRARRVERVNVAQRAPRPFAALAFVGGVAAVTLGSPTRLDWGLALAPLIPAAAQVVDPKWTLPVVVPSSLSAPLSGTAKEDPMQVLIYNPKNVELETWRRLMATGIGDVSMAVARTRRRAARRPAMHRIRPW